jgi:hypothetical protein
MAGGDSQRPPGGTPPDSAAAPAVVVAVGLGDRGDEVERGWSSSDLARTAWSDVLVTPYGSPGFAEMLVAMPLHARRGSRLRSRAPDG